MTFDPNKHLVKIKTKQGMQDYLKVQWRLVWFREQCPEGVIETKMLHLDTEQQIAVFEATASTGTGGLAMGHGSEKASDFNDYIEKAETKAIGRALAALGFGTQFTGDELDEGERIVDAPAQPAKPALSPVPVEQPTSEINVPVPSKLRALFAQIGTTLETAENLTFKRVKNDLELTPEECFQLHQVYDAWKIKYDEKQAS